MRICSVTLAGPGTEFIIGDALKSADWVDSRVVINTSADTQQWVTFHRVGAEIVGVNTHRIHALVFGLGIVLAMAAGMILSPLLFVIPTIGHTYTLKAFVVIVLGGMGSIPGAIAGGLLLGVVEFLGASYLSSGYRDAYGLVAFLLVLLLRPQGLFGRSVRRV